MLEETAFLRLLKQRKRPVKITKTNVALVAVCAVVGAPSLPLQMALASAPRQTAETSNAGFSPALRAVGRGALSRLAKPGAATPPATLDRANRFEAGDGRAAFLARLEAAAATPNQKRAMRVYGEGVFRITETAYRAYGYREPDWGVAWAALLETAWEMNDGSFKLGNGTEADKRRTQASVAQVRQAIARTPGAASLSDTDKEFAYQFASFTAGHLALQWGQAGEDADKREAVQKLAREQLTNIFGVEPAALTRRTNGEFVNANASAADAVAAVTTAKVGRTASRRPGTSAAPPTAKVSGGPLPAASLGGARVFIRYTITYLDGAKTNFDHLILFPDGSAFLDVPSKPAARFDSATYRAALSRFDVGTWKASGGSLSLSFPNKREPIITLRKHPRGWYDAGEKTPPKADSAYDVYFPIVTPTAKTLRGAWKSQSLTTMGTMGGGAPMVAAGRTGNRVFSPNGTFTDASTRFASATTSNMGDAFKGDGSVTTTSTGKGGGAGRWRLDGPLLTLELNGVRTVQLAFILPYWGKKEKPDLLINGDWWERPEK